MAVRLAAEAGLNLVDGSFEEGATVSLKTQVVWQQATGKIFGWFQDAVKTVGAGSTPETSGGIGAGAWVDRTDVTLRSDLNIVVKVFESVADMKSDASLIVRQKCRTLGYYTVGDGGGNDYEIVAAATGTDDGGSYINLSGSGFQANGLFGSVVNVKQFGAVGDGVVSDTASIQAAIYASSGRKLTFDGSKTHFVTFVDGPQGKMCLDLPSNITVDFNSAEIVCETNDFTNYQILNLYKKKNVVLNDPNIIGDVDTHTGTAGEAGYGVLVRCCEHVEINRPKISKCWGDGLLIGSDTVSTNIDIVINHGVFDDNRRRGSSVGGGLGIVYNDCTFSNTGRTKSTAPSAGLDIEPDTNKNADLDVKVNNCRFFGNKGGAAHVIISGCLSAPTLNAGVCEVNVKFSGCTSMRDNSYLTTESKASIRVGGAAAVSGANKLVGAIDFDNFTITETATAAVFLTNPVKAYPPIRFNNLVVNDVFSGVPLGASMPTSSIVYFDIFPEVSRTSGFEIGDIDFNGLTYRDSRGLTFSSTATASNHRVKRPVWHRNLDPDTSLKRVRFRRFKTEIQPDSLNFIVNGECGDYCSFDEDSMFVNVTASILSSNVGETWGLGVIPIITGTGSSTFIVELPSTNGRVGTYQIIKSHMDGTRPLQFRAGTTAGVANQVLYLDGVRTSDPKTMPQSAGEFRFYCPVGGLWVQQ
jgi:hypothetical protein